jgi:hypothetical protein
MLQRLVFADACCLKEKRGLRWHGVQTVPDLRTKSSPLAMVNAGSVSEPERSRALLIVQSKARRKTAGVVADQGCAKHVEALERCNG